MIRVGQREKNEKTTIRVVVCFFTVIALALATCLAVLFTIRYGPPKAFRDRFSLSAGESGAEDYLAASFLPDETTEQVIADSAIKPSDTVTDPETIAINTSNELAGSLGDEDSNGGSEEISPSPAEVVAMEATLGGAVLKKLADGDYQTKVSLAAGQTITMVAEEPIRFVYLIWSKAPDAPILVADGMQYAAGQHGFLHELLVLKRATEQIELTVGGDSVLADVYLLGPGALPAWVERWQPPLAQADLLVLPTHADDELLFFGGILPTYAGERRMAVQVVYMTGNWVGGERMHEALNGLWTVGVRNYPVVGPFNDKVASKDSLAAATEIYGHDAVLTFQVEMLRRFKPLVVVGHDLKGEYGHGAHRLNALTLTEALELSGNAGSYPQSAATYGLWDVPKAYLHLYAENKIVMDWTVPLDSFAGRTAFDMAVEGYDKHVSQHRYAFAVKLGGTWEDCRKFGLYRSTVGPDIEKNDLFENLAERKE